MSQEACVEASESASPSLASTHRASRSALKSEQATLAVDSDVKSNLPPPRRRFAALPITVLEAPVARPRRVPSSNSENERPASPACDESVERRALPKCSRVLVSAMPVAPDDAHKKKRSKISNYSPVLLNFDLRFAHYSL